MLPNYDENEFLPEGVWDCSLEELQTCFAAFRRSDRRLKFFAELEKFLAEIIKTNWVKEIIIDGSFVTEKEEPNDIDIILALHKSTANIETPFWIENTLDRTRLAKKYKFDVMVVLDQSRKYQVNLDFFQQVRQSDLRKGVVRLTL
ncbi:MAG: hypothetical protein M3Q99_12720 [Acidobacteriota bacterium]|nr:hypothetical protein [Acidobacteriota bacterium]